MAEAQKEEQPKPMTPEGKWMIEIKKHEPPPQPKAPLWPVILLVLVIAFILLPPQSQQRLLNGTSVPTRQPR